MKKDLVNGIEFKFRIILGKTKQVTVIRLLNRSFSITNSFTWSFNSLMNNEHHHIKS